MRCGMLGVGGVVASRGGEGGRQPVTASSRAAAHIMLRVG